MAERRPSSAAPSMQHTPTRNTNIWSTRQLVTMALMCAVGVLLSFIEIPLFPAAPFLKYDASLVPAMLCGFAYGPGAGVAVGIVGAVIHGILLADLVGAIMNILVVAGFILPAAFVYRRTRTWGAAAVGLACGGIGAIVLALAANLVLTPAYMGVPFDAVVSMLVPILLPFNVLKSVVNAVLSFAVYRIVIRFFDAAKGGKDA